MTVALHEIEPGVWIVPELVDRVEARIESFDYFTWSVIVHMVFGGEVQCRSGQANVECVRRNALGQLVIATPDMDLDGLNALAQAAVREVVAWIDARRTEPLTVVKDPSQ